ncbi:MAG: hypothetical protein ACK47B_01805 [Armatimonadota bacterium]
MTSRAVQSKSRTRRGQVLVVALSLILGLVMLVAGMQIQTLSQLGASRPNRDYERALQYAEAGLNAYVSLLSKGAGTGTNAGTIPSFAQFAAMPTLDEFRTGVQNGTYSTSSTPAFIPFPPGSTDSGYCVGHVGTPGAFVTIVAYGYCRGTVRRVRGDGRAFSIFDWAALWGMRPSGGDAWLLRGDANIVGAAGGEGRMKWGNNNVFYDGPLVAAGPNAAWADANGNNNPPGPPVNGNAKQSAPNDPVGHVGTGVLANPWLRNYTRSIGLPTADEAANEWGGGTTGVEQFRNNNHNATGLRYLVQHKTTGVIRELPGSYSPANSANDYVLSWPSGRGTYSALGMTSDEDPYGIRVYPGNYYFTRINMGPSDKLLLRTFNDGDRSDPTVSAGRQLVVQGDPANPNSGMALERNIRFWIGHASSGSDQESRFERLTSMEYPQFPSRFRIYNANSGGIQVRGSNSGPKFTFNVNLLSYNRTAAGAGYGAVTFTSAVYLRGSLLAWTVDVSGGTTIEKFAPELGPDDLLTYVIERWTELP